MTPEELEQIKETLHIPEGPPPFVSGFALRAPPPRGKIRENMLALVKAIEAAWKERDDLKRKIAEMQEFGR